MLTIDIIFPGFLLKIRNLPLFQPIFEKTNEFQQKKEDIMQNVLGESQGSFSLNGKKNWGEKVKVLTKKIIEEETVQEAAAKINNVFKKTTTELENLPQSQAKKVKTEVKRQICEEMLKDF